MSGPRFAAFAGSRSRPSKTRALVEAARFGGQAHVFDVDDLGPGFGALRAGREPALDRHRAAFLAADALIVASPACNGSFVAGTLRAGPILERLDRAVAQFAPHLHHALAAPLRVAG